MNNKLSLTAISFLANFVMAGFATQFGMLIDPIAAKFGADVNQVASIFSLLNGGALAGTIAAFFLIEKVGLKRMTLLCYGLIALAAAALHLTGSLYVVMAAMTVIGLCGGVGLCIAGTLVVSVWQARMQSTMLVVQDATFNVAGVVFPLITTYTLTHAMAWSWSYLAVGVVALATMLVAVLTNFRSCEAGGESYTGMVAVGAVVVNRVNSGSFPNSVSGVIYQGGQFTPVATGTFQSVLARGARSDCYAAAQAALAGESPVGGCLYFNSGYGSGIQIGYQHFY